MATLNKTKTLSLVSQRIALQQAFPNSNCRLRRNKLSWKATLQPTGLSDSYEVQLTHSLERNPKIFVCWPKLCDRDNQLVPHRYNDGSLCLFLPRKREWNQGMFLSETTVPWACEWLFHYELWQATGEWHGGGLHPGDNKKGERM